MFRLSRPKLDEIEREILLASKLSLRPKFLSVNDGLAVRPPSDFSHDQSRSEIGKGRDAFHAAICRMKKWEEFDLGWVRVANDSVKVEVGQIVAVEVHSLGMWSINLSQIVEVVQKDDVFGFTYKTTSSHLEEGEERFVLTFDRKSQSVHYNLEAVSRPNHPLARLALPVTRAFQHRFARDSHRRMRESAH